MNTTNPQKWTQVLMVEPSFFEVEYAINPHMLDKNGNLNKIYKSLASKQWSEIKNLYEKLGIKVHVLPGTQGLPDQVFSANQLLPFLNPKTGERSAVLSKMKSHARQPEVHQAESFAKGLGYKIYKLESAERFEANGDMIPHPGKNFFWGGVGPRTEIAAYQEIQERFGLEVQTLNLVHPDFYHLDTAFVVINDQTCGFVAEAFDKQSIAKIKAFYTDPVEIDLSEGQRFFPGNAFCPDGKNVILQSGATKFIDALIKRGFNVHEVDTSEFLKSGGSVFCMKLALV